MTTKWNMEPNWEMLLEAPNPDTLRLLQELKRVRAEFEGKLEVKFRAAEGRCNDLWIEMVKIDEKKAGSPCWYFASRIVIADILAMLKKSVSRWDLVA